MFFAHSRPLSVFTALFFCFLAHHNVTQLLEEDCVTKYLYSLTSRYCSIVKLFRAIPWLTPIKSQPLRCILGLIRKYEHIYMIYHDVRLRKTITVNIRHLRYRILWHLLRVAKPLRWGYCTAFSLERHSNQLLITSVPPMIKTGVHVVQELKEMW